MDKGIRYRTRINWTFISIALAIAILISVCAMLSRHANKNKSYTGAKFIVQTVGGWHDGT